MSHVLVLNSDSQPINCLPLSTIDWQVAIKAMYLDTVSVIAEYDDWEVHSPSMTIRVPSIIMTKTYLHFQRKLTFNDEQLFLRDRYTCQYCLKIFPKGRLTMDHVLPRSHGGRTTWDNISASCSPCNLKKGSDKRVLPNKMPWKPSYYELLAIRKEYPLSVPCEDWVDYLDWPEDKLFVNDKKILRTQLVA